MWKIDLKLQEIIEELNRQEYVFWVPKLDVEDDFVPDEYSIIIQGVYERIFDCKNCSFNIMDKDERLMAILHVEEGKLLEYELTLSGIKVDQIIGKVLRLPVENGYV